jgi:hypothetical protein
MPVPLRVTPTEAARTELVGRFPARRAAIHARRDPAGDPAPNRRCRHESGGGRRAAGYVRSGWR